MAYKTDTAVLLTTITLASATATVTFSSLPSTYTSIEILVSTRSDTASGAMDFGMLRLNGDTAANYGQGSSATSTSLSVIRPITSTNWLTSGWTNGTIAIWDYSSSSKHKCITYDNSYNNSTTTMSSANYHDDAGWWRSAAVVTSASLVLSSGGNYITGSTFRVYGIP